MPTSSETSAHAPSQAPEASRPARTGDAHGPAAEAEDRDLRRDNMLRFVERFAMFLGEIGLPRMPARVFAYVICDDRDRYTAAELASALQVSPAAISGAVRTLTQMRLLGREREPGARVDTYRVYDDDLWGTITTQREQMVEPFERLASEGVELLGPETPGGQRLRETQEYFRFFRLKLQEYMVEWQAHKEKLFGTGESTEQQG